MDSSKRADGKEKEDGYKKLRTNLQESSHVASSGASTAPGGSNEAQELHSIPLNILKQDEIDLIADRLSIMDRLHFQQAFANDPEEVVNNIRNGIAANLAKQRALYLLIGRDEYDVKYQYNYQLEGQLPSSLLPTLEGLPIASEAFKMITLSKLEKDGCLDSISFLQRTFPNLVELKIVMQGCPSVWLPKLVKVVTAFSPQLTALQLLIFSNSIGLTTCNGFHQRCLLSRLNECRFPGLRHFTLLFEDIEDIEEVTSRDEKSLHLNLKSLALLSSETLVECYLRLPALFIDWQMRLLEANRRLQRVGLIACYHQKELVNRYKREKTMWRRLSLIHSFDKKILISPSLAAKIVHLLFLESNILGEVKVLSYDWWRKLNQLEQFISLRSLYIELDTDDAYLTLAKKLLRLGSLTHLQINLHYVPVSELAFCRPLSQLAPCSPSVTHLKIKVRSITGGGEEGRLEFSHLIFSHLSIVRHFPNLQQLEVVFSAYNYYCSLCKDTPADDGRECVGKAMQPFRARDQLKLFFYCPVFKSAVVLREGGS